MKTTGPLLGDLTAEASLLRAIRATGRWEALDGICDSMGPQVDPHHTYAGFLAGTFRSEPDVLTRPAFVRMIARYADGSDAGNGFAAALDIILGKHLARKVLYGVLYGAIEQDGVRDPNAICVDFAKGPSSGDCAGDGHYLCRQCRRLDPGAKP